MMIQKAVSPLLTTPRGPQEKKGKSDLKMIRGYDNPVLFRQDTLIRIRYLKADFAAIEAEMAAIEAKTSALQEQAKHLENPDDDPDCEP